jgi:predicted nucleotidyltransferase
MKTCDYLESLLGLSVELITLESMSPYLKPYIEKEAVHEKL